MTDDHRERKKSIVSDAALSNLELEKEYLRYALAELLDYTKRLHSGDSSLHSEEFFIATVYAANALADTDDAA